jgi:hypothetical protein
MTRDEFNELAWVDFIEFATGNAEMRAAFTAETGVPCFSDAEWIGPFVDWATVNHWGAAEAPVKWREAHA